MSSCVVVWLLSMALGQPVPMQVVSVTTTQATAPCLVGGQHNVLATLHVVTSGSQEPLVVTRVDLDLAGCTDPADIETIALVDETGAGLAAPAPVGRRKPPAHLAAAERRATAERETAAAERRTLTGRLPLREGRNELPVIVTLAPTADIDHVVDVGCLRVTLSDGSVLEPDVTHPPGAQRMGVALRNGGDDGAAVYRIPGLVTTPAGTLIAVYDVRWAGWSDLPADVDVGMSRSVDGGRHWEPMAVIVDMGKDPTHAFDGVGDPAVLVDRETGTLWVAAVWSHGDRAWHGSGPGLAPDETGQLVLVRSDDDGLSWSAPINITKEVKRPEWAYLLQGPGRGITMSDGTLVFAAQFQAAPDDGRLPHATILFSRDHGETWQLGTGVRPDTTEAQVVELEPGTLMLNCRDNRGGSRSIFTTVDLGQTWTEHPTSRRALVEPVCNAGLLAAGDGVLLFSNPAVPAPPRRRMTLKASLDRGLTWDPRHALLLDEGTSAGYSSLTLIDAETLGVLYEGSAAQLVFQRVPLGATLGP